MLHMQRATFASSTNSSSKHGQGYGDPEGSPEADIPRSSQTPANKRQTSGEHPGPEPVAAGKGKGGDGANVEGSGGAYGESPTSEHPKNPGEASAESGGSRSKDRMEEHREEDGVSGGDGASKGGAPIMASGSQQPKSGSKDGSGSAGKHNADFENRGNHSNVEKDNEREDDKVGKMFWQGRSNDSYSNEYRNEYTETRRRGFWNRGLFILPLPFGFVYNVNKHDREREGRNRRMVNEYGDEVEREKQIEDGIVGDVYYEAQ